MRSGHLAFLAISSRYQTQFYCIVACPEVYPHSPGCRQVPLDTSFHSSHNSLITSSICRSTSTCQVGTPAFLAISSRFQTQVHSIVGSPEIYPLSLWCRQVPLDTSFHSSHKLSTTFSICRSTSTCDVGILTFLAISSRFQKQVHSIVASPEILALSPRCRQVLLDTNFHFSLKP